MVDRTDLYDAGVRNQNIETVVMVDGVVNQRLHLIAITDVARARPHFGPASGELLSGMFEFFGVARANGDLALQPG
jgi:hypothetical protein